ncbi:translocation/assembly module TamB domain-containing protein [Arachidicoccus terrestris]|uniref:translocation/assembly module TamB domain-containing protein n=1 Tax=Arachidicoccus terrestris TaxID=2875539 RepID=UPI001CC7CF9B|nr:translocation/assembly module TamB [Arachidicoccus terrestris]UAY55239.1 translocation/assembly module TamB [Arachidicoccus terrestris]
MTKTLRIALKTLLWVLGSVILVLVLVVLLLQVPSVQNFIRKKAVSYLENKLGTKVEIASIYLKFPTALSVKGVYLEDQHRDTLLYSQDLEARLDLWKLFKKRLVVDQINWQGVTAKISRTKDSIYNFDYIIAAFADTTQATEDTSSSSSFAIDLDRINLDRIQMTYNDSVDQNYIHFYVGHFDTRVSEFDLNKMRFGIPVTHLSNVRANIQQLALSEASPVADTATEPLNMTLSVGKVDLSKIWLNYHSAEMDAGIDLARLLVNFDRIDLAKQKIGIRQIQLDTTSASVVMRNPTTVTKVVSETAKHIDTLITPANNAPWSLSVNKIVLNNNRVRFDNEAMPDQKEGLDYGHLDMQHIHVLIDNFWFVSDSMQGNIKALSLKDRSGFAVDSLSGIFFYGPRAAYFKDFFLRLPNSELKDQIAISYPSLDAVAENPSLLGINATIENSYVGMQDVLMIAPFLKAYPAITNFTASRVRLKAKLEGKVGDLNIPTLEVSGLGNTSLKATGHLMGLPDPDKTFMNLTLRELTTTGEDINKMMPAGVMPEGYQLPVSMQASGYFEGTISKFKTDLVLNSSDGNAGFKGQVDMRTTDQETYQGYLTAEELNIGKMTGMQDMVGKISLQTDLKGKSFNPKKASLALKGVIHSLELKGYDYQNLNFKADADQGKYTVAAAMADPNIHFDLTGDADMTSRAPALNLDLQLDSADFQALHLTTDTLKLHTHVSAGFASADPDSLNGSIDVKNLVLVSGNKRLQADSLSFVSKAGPDSSSLTLDAATLGLTAVMQGQYQLTKLAPAFQQLFNKYMAVDSLPALPVGDKSADSLTIAHKKAENTITTNRISADSTSSDSTSHQQFSFNAQVFRTPMLASFLPELRQMDTIRITGRFDNKEPVLDIRGVIPSVVYDTDTLSGGHLSIQGDNSQLNYMAGFKHAAVGDAVQLYEPSIAGTVRQNKLNALLNVHDQAGKPYYRLGAQAAINGSQLQMRLLPDSLLLDYTPWKVQPDNFIRYDSSGILIHNFGISDRGQQLLVQSVPEAGGAPLKVNFKDFKIETLTKIINQDSIQVGGILSGEATIDSVMTNPLVTANMNIQDLNFKTDTIGNIALNIDNKTAGKYQTHVAITGQGNQVDLAGAYYTNPESKMDFELNVQKLALKSIEGLTLGYLKDMNGSLDGRMTIQGSIDQPKINGQLHFNQAAFNVAMLNAPFTMPDEKIQFDDEGIVFNRVHVLDQQKNRLTIDGRIKTTNFTDYGFALRVNARDFQVISSTKADNPLYYGKLYMDARMNIDGNMNSPVVDGTIGVRDKTDLTIVVPSADPSVEEREGVVEFVKKNPQPNLDSILVERQLDSLRNTAVQGMDISATINVDKNALFSIVLDERNGDMVKLRGEAHLNGGIDPSGKTSLTGTYEVNDGSYNLSYATVKRKFTFKKGSTIVWTGDPTSANVDLTAVYIANVPPLDLVENQLTGTENTVQFKQKLPFEVNLMMKNELLKPEISFDIMLPDDKSKVNVSGEVTTAVNTRLAQIRMDPNEMNKQVLGVLVLGHFIGDNPLQSMVEGQTVEGALRNSVSSLLSDQLNRLADNLISGVDLDFGLTSGEDYSSGTATNRTDLNVGLSKSFLNDRLTVSVGNNFNLEGAQAGEKATSIAGNVSIGYKLSRDGRYLLRAYRNDHFIVIQGQVVETGIGFSMTLDYDTFKEILKGKTEKQKEWRRRFRKRQRMEREQEDSTGNDNTTTKDTYKAQTKDEEEQAAVRRQIEQNAAEAKAEQTKQSSSSQ